MTISYEETVRKGHVASEQIKDSLFLLHQRKTGYVFFFRISFSCVIIRKTESPYFFFPSVPKLYVQSFA